MCCCLAPQAQHAAHKETCPRTLTPPTYRVCKACLCIEGVQIHVRQHGDLLLSPCGHCRCCRFQSQQNWTVARARLKPVLCGMKKRQANRLLAGLVGLAASPSLGRQHC
jgi:hypothetical protein